MSLESILACSVTSIRSPAIVCLFIALAVPYCTAWHRIAWYLNANVVLLDTVTIIYASAFAHLLLNAWLRLSAPAWHEIILFYFISQQAAKHATVRPAELQAVCESNFTTDLSAERKAHSKPKPAAVLSSFLVSHYVVAILFAAAVCCCLLMLRWHWWLLILFYFISLNNLQATVVTAFEPAVNVSGAIEQMNTSTKQNSIE